MTGEEVEVSRWYFYWLDAKVSFFVYHLLQGVNIIDSYVVKYTKYIYTSQT